ncbi:MAG: DinB family protein [Micropruina sp.]
MEQPASIPPETKDWTVVLTQGCDQCDYQAPPADQVAERLRATIPRWQAVLARAEAASRPQPQVWSPLEYACHVRDVCAIFGVRTRQMLAQNNPTFLNWDQDATAVQDAYWAQDPAYVARQYAEEATLTAAIFDSVGADDWDRPGTRSNGSLFTVASLLVYFLHDIEHHLADVAG